MTASQKQLVTNISRLVTIETGTVAQGDVNGDGTVDAVDALMVLQTAVEKLTLTAKQRVAGDLTADGVLDAADALMILKQAVGKSV